MLFGHTLSISQRVMHLAGAHCCVFLQVEATVVPIREPTSDIRISELTQPCIGLFPMRILALNRVMGIQAGVT